MTQKIILASLRKQGYPETANVARLPLKALKQIGKNLAREAGKIIDRRDISRKEKQKLLLSLKYGLHQALLNHEIKKILKQKKISPDTPVGRLEIEVKEHVINKLWEFFAQHISAGKKVSINEKIRMFYSLRKVLKNMKNSFKKPQKPRANAKGNAYKTYYFDPSAFEFDFQELSLDEIDPFYKFRKALFDTFEQLEEVKKFYINPWEYIPMRVVNALKGDILLTKYSSDIGASISAMMGSDYTSAMMFVDDGYTVKKVSMDFNAVGIEQWENAGWTGWDNTFRKLNPRELANGIPGIEQRQIEDVYSPAVAGCSLETRQIVYQASDAVLIKPADESFRQDLIRVADKYMNLSGYYRLNALMHFMGQMDDTHQQTEGKGATDGSGIWYAVKYALNKELAWRNVDADRAMEYAKILYENFYNTLLDNNYTPQWYREYTHDNVIIGSVEEFCKPEWTAIFSPGSSLLEFFKNSLSLAVVKKCLEFPSVFGIVVFIIKTIIWDILKNYGTKEKEEIADKIANQICNTIFFNDPGNTSGSWRCSYKEEKNKIKNAGRKKTSSDSHSSSLDHGADPDDIQDIPGHEPGGYSCPPGKQVLPDDLLPRSNGSAYYSKTVTPEIEGGYFLKNGKRVVFQ